MKQRLDTLLVIRGLVRSRSRAVELIRTGKVTVGGVVVTKPATPVAVDAALSAVDDVWVSRAAFKLLGALSDLQVAVPRRVLDAGSSTGGFTQVLLARGAERVYAVDVGTDQLAPALRGDPRVVVHEQTNLRDLTLAHVEQQRVGLLVADVSFISLTLLLAPMLAVVDDHGAALLMVKPQFEVGRAQLGRDGVVRDVTARNRAVSSVVAAAEQLGWSCIGRSDSRLMGPAGNLEVFLHLRPTDLC
jgi:23S rRNA (cytidine1920-2'-O)/16S rRNA (cytidine1409-2'-O)-methyltransferase